MFDPPNLAQVCSNLLSTQSAAQAGCILTDEAQISALDETKAIFQAVTPGGVFILRFALSEKHLRILHKEERIQAGLGGCLPVQIPNTQIIPSGAGLPPYAIHSKIMGEPLTETCLQKLSVRERRRLVSDLVDLFHSLHNISLQTACAWLEPDFHPIACQDHVSRQALAGLVGKPLWFNAPAVEELRPKLSLRLDKSERDSFEQTVTEFNQIPLYPAGLVFGHGDLHGFNMAVLAAPDGYRLNGVFDLGCTGILDIHEDFFRLSLVSERLLDEILQAYQDLTAWRFTLNRERISVYYRAFLFYLMADQQGAGLEKLRRMLAKHTLYRPIPLKA